ncbi:TlpA disulfide reductase family protein [Hyalangium gracile]|uniref:TlpA disulfide reductase family protein n=1 Tax=Hyalangium gracile TaxID=394092 RepID=UPI001CCEB94B|nr:TlpA disulfide reductase family protein [Hyalangium gracile]
MSLARLLALTAALLASQAFAERAPPFDVTDLEGRRYTLGALSGKIVVLNFWFKDCPPCRHERRALNRVVARYQSNPGVVFLAPALDKADELRPFLSRYPLHYAVIPEAEELAETYGVSGFPTHVVIGRDGNIVERWTSATDAFLRLTEAIDSQLEPPQARKARAPTIVLPAQGSPVWESPLLVSPERPVRGGTVKLYYAPASLQHPAEALVAWDVHGDGSFTQGVAPMRPRGVLLSYELKLPEDATLVHLRVLSRGDRRFIEHTLPISDAQGRPVRNAFVDVGACGIPLPIERELEHHPHSPFALLARLEERLGPPAHASELAPGELRELLKTAEGTALELLAITVDALLLARDFKNVTQVLDHMVRLEPGAFLTRRALSRLLTQPYGDVSRQWPPTLLPWAWQVLAERDDVWSRLAASQSSASVTDTLIAERICSTWRAAEPDNPLAHDCLARVLEQQGRLPEALAASRASLEAASTGKLPLYHPGGWSQAARAQEELWARHAELSLESRELAGAPEP